MVYLRSAVPEVPLEFGLDTKTVVTVATDPTFHANVLGVRSLLNAFSLVTDKFVTVD
jgi:hypothetical protein